MKPLNIVLLAAAGLLGAYLFLLYGNRQQEQQAQEMVDHRLQEERFDRDFEQVWNRNQLPQDADRDGRIAELRAELEAIQQRNQRENTVDRIREDEIRAALSRLSERR